MFLERTIENYPLIIIKYPLYLLHCNSKSLFIIFLKAKQEPNLLPVRMYKYWETDRKHEKFLL